MTIRAVCEVCDSSMIGVSGWIFRCPLCGLYHTTLTPGIGTGPEGLEHLRRSNFELILDRLERERSLAGRRLLEVGCAKGWFLEAAARRGMLTQGLEPEESSVATAIRNGLSVELGSFPAGLHNRGPYDVIIFNDVLEHLPSPTQAIKECENLLSVNGVLVINFPSSSGFLFFLARVLAAVGFDSPLERLWQKDFSSPHIWYFNPDNIKLLMQNNTKLAFLDAFSLPSVDRIGLYRRIRSSHKGILGGVMFFVMWGLSIILPLMPADIHVAVFRKDAKY